MERVPKALVPTFLSLLWCLAMLSLTIGCAQKPPTIESIEPDSGPSGGGTRITITGKNFKKNATVTLGGVALKEMEINPAETLVKGTTQGGLPGIVDVVAKNPNAKQPSVAAKFTYEELKVVSTDPSDTAELSSPIDQVSVEFSQDIKAGSATITVEGITGEVRYDSATRVATFTARKLLKPGKSYTVKVSGAKDLADNVMTDYTFGFKIEEASKYQRPSEVKAQGPSLRESQESELQEGKTPIWSETELEKTGGAVVTYEETINIRPLFYTGSMPLKLISGKKFLAMNEMITLYRDFEGFRNTFIYVNPSMAFSGIAEGARTTDASGRLLAEARLLRLISGENKQLQGIEIEEFHYSANGRLQFQCKSRIDFPMGVKQTETEQMGEKTRDYYFIWPVTNF